MRSVEVEIFGRKFRLRTDDAERTIEVVNAINTQLRELDELYETLDFSKLLLLLAFRLQEKIIDLNSQNNTLSTELEQMNLMVGKIIGES